MKQTMKNMLSMAAAVLAAAVMTACAGGDELTDTPQQPENQSKTITLTTTVGLGGGAADAGTEAGAGTRAATTRALTAGGVKTFAAGERMALVYTKAGAGGAKVVVESEALTGGDIETTGDDATDSKSATFTFRLTEAPDKTAPVRYIYPAAMAKSEVAADAELDNAGTVDLTKLNAQDGTMGSLASSLDLATYTHAWDGGNLPEGTLANQLAILAITLKDYSGTSIITGGLNEVAVSAVTSEGTNTYTVTPTGSTFGEEVIYVAIRPTAGATIKVTATDGTNNYVKTLTGKDYEINNGYNVSWLMTEATPLSETTPMTMEALTDGNIKVYYPKSNMKYSVNGGAKISISSTENPKTITVEAGDKVEFYGNGTNITQYGSRYGLDYTTIVRGTAQVKVYGNIMSLVDEEGFATATTLTAENTFSNLFSSNTALTDASGLLLPAPTMTQSCYEGMFHSCSSLTTAPALPATTLAESCYTAMFWECTNLKTAPALPATTLAPACYGSMFWKCTSLTDAPAELPATTLAFGCYQSMFHDCTSLETAPALPATTLADYCYMGMFSGCTKLNAVTCLATNIDAIDCTAFWLEDVAPSGTFTKNPSMTGWPRNNSDEDEYIDYGIPSGWTVEDAE